MRKYMNDTEFKSEETVSVWRPERHGGVWQEGFSVISKKGNKAIVRKDWTELEVEVWRVR